MILRAATPADHPALAELFLRARRIAFTWISPASIQLDDFAEQTEGEHIHLAEDEAGGILGFISLWESESFIHHLFVSPDQQRKGIGAALLDDLFDRLPGPFRLKCLLPNQAALAFYRGHGFAEIGQGTSVEGDYLLLEARQRRKENTACVPHVPIDRRPATRDDLEFLWDLHILTLLEYVALTWGWDRTWQRENFLKRFDPASLEILEARGIPMGVLGVRYAEDHLYLREIQIHPDWQGRGIGAAMVADIVAHAAARRLPVRLQVLKVNPARRLYERCGFCLRGETETHFLMEHPASG